MKYADLELKKLELDDLQAKYLIENGWVRSCKNPASVWLWVKRFDDCDLALSLDAALYMQLCSEGREEHK